ncbi:heme-binding protein [Rhizobium sp. Nf11,1]|uniref:heme-binding protein n=1 Tax=Rhizobium sp. Nf11,1 TaxID=3404923 RepID=UPI003D334ED0
MPPFEIILRLALQLLGNGIQNHDYAPLHRSGISIVDGQQLVNQENLRQARYGEVSQPGKPAYGINSAIGGRLLVVAGGVPVVVDGQVVGAIGVSSGTPVQDSDCAQAGIDLFLRDVSG